MNTTAEFGSLSPELYTRIVNFVSPPGRVIQSHSTKKTLYALSLVSKGCNAAASVPLYSFGLCGSIHLIGKACRTISLYPDKGYGAHVKTVYLYPPSSVATPTTTASTDDSSNRGSHLVPNTYFTAIQSALLLMPNLECLIFFGSGDSTETWVLNPGSPFPFQIREFRFNQLWDQNIAEFISTQTQLRRLIHTPYLERQPDHVAHVMPLLEPSALPLLTVFEGPLVSALDLVNGRLDPDQHPSPNSSTTLSTRPIGSLCIDSSQFPEHYLTHYKNRPVLSHFQVFQKTLKSLRLLSVLPEYPPHIFPVLTQMCPQVYQLGIFPWDPATRHPFVKSLASFPNLQIIELDVSDLTLPRLPAPPYHLSRHQIWQWAHEERLRRYMPSFRSIASELRTYCPSIIQVILWHSKGYNAEHGYEERYILQCSATEKMLPHERRYWSMYTREEGFMDWFIDVELERRRRSDMSWVYYEY